MTKQIRLIFILISIGVVLSGCPRIAKINIYNNTGVDIVANTGENITVVAPKTSETINFTSSSLIVESIYGKWKYGRHLIPYGGEDGPYFDGSVYLQINENGQILAARENEKRPLSELAIQPEGFPIEPSL